MQLIKLLPIALLFVIGCKSKSYLVKDTTHIKKIVDYSIQDTTQGPKLDSITDLTKYYKRSNGDSLGIRIVKNHLQIITPPKKEIIIDSSSVKEYTNSGIERKKIRAEQDSVHVANKLAIKKIIVQEDTTEKKIQAKTRELRIDVHKDKPGFFGNLAHIVGQIKWILLTAAICGIIYLIVRTKKWLL